MTCVFIHILLINWVKVNLRELVTDAAASYFDWLIDHLENSTSTHSGCHVLQLNPPLPTPPYLHQTHSHTQKCSLDIWSHCHLYVKTQAHMRACTYTYSPIFECTRAPRGKRSFFQQQTSSRFDKRTLFGRETRDHRGRQDTHSSMWPLTSSASHRWLWHWDTVTHLCLAWMTFVHLFVTHTLKSEMAFRTLCGKESERYRALPWHCCLSLVNVVSASATPCSVSTPASPYSPDTNCFHCGKSILEQFCSL